jgi:hypothetical protein
MTTRFQHQTKEAGVSGSSRRGRFVQQGLVGLAGGLIGGLAMNAYARAVSRATGGRESDGAAPGGDRVGRGMQPPQAHGQANEDAAVRVGSIAYRALTGHQPDPEIRCAVGSTAHYAFSAAAGVSYALIADRVPSMRTCFGALYGTIVWAVADEGIMPALGLSRGPRQLPIGIHIYSLVGHWLYGATVESVRRLALPSTGSHA